MITSNQVRHTRKGLSIVLTTALLFAPVGCASEPRPRPTSLDPSSPAAPESPPLVLAALSPLGTAKGGDGGKGSKGDKGGTGASQPAVIYTCPMHPEVSSDKPGKCPICGMTLVPKAPGDGKK